MSIQGLLQATAVVTVLLSVVTGLDIPHRHIELFSHFRLQYLVVSVVLVFVFGVLRNPAYAGVLLITAIFNASFVLPWYVGDAPSSSGPPLKLVHANVRASSTEYQRLLDFVEAEDLRIDTHGAAVDEQSWQLLADAYAHFGPVPTLLERDFNFPLIDELLAEVGRIRDLQREAKNQVAARG